MRNLKIEKRAQFIPFARYNCVCLLRHIVLLIDSVFYCAIYTYTTCINNEYDSLMFGLGKYCTRFVYKKIMHKNFKLFMKIINVILQYVTAVIMGNIFFFLFQKVDGNDKLCGYPQL